MKFKFKNGDYSELLTPETMKISGSKINITKDASGENVPHLEIIEVVLVLVHRIILNNNYQNNSRFLYTFVPNKLFGKLLYISLKNIIISKTFNSEFSYIEVWFTGQNSKSLEIEGKINMTLVIN